MGCDAAVAGQRGLQRISIHASRMGCDLYYDYVDKWFHVFQSTHPVWDATRVEPSWLCRCRISIHASRMGCDLLTQTDLANIRREFQSTHPVWDATHDSLLYSLVFLFQSTHPVWDATRSPSSPWRSWQFQSTHPVWDATRQLVNVAVRCEISIHASRMGCDQRLHAHH